MPIDVYVGNEGTGKTYQVVTVAIKEAINQGRRVFTNIRGVNRDLIVEHLTKENKNDGRLYGEVVQFRTGQILEDPLFFPDLSDDKFQSLADIDLTKHQVQPGDLLAIDEAYEAFPKEKQFSMRFYLFFRKHRQYVNQTTKLSTEIILLIQDWKRIHPDTISTVAYTYQSVDLKEIGSNGKFTIHVYKGKPLYRAKPERSLILQTYEKEKFPWYKSHAVEGAQQRAVDDRRNIFKSKYFLYVGLLTPVALAACIYFIYDYFKHPAMLKNKQKHKTTQTPIKPINTNQPITPHQQTQNNQSQSQEIKTWRITGYVDINGKKTFYITDGEKIDVLLNPESQHIGRIIKIKHGDIWIDNTQLPQSRSAFSQALPAQTQ